MSQTIPSTDPYLSLISDGKFRPFYSPKDMLILGVFGGAFFSGKAVVLLNKLPKDIADVGRAMDAGTFDVGLNYFGVSSMETGPYTAELTPDLKMLHPFGWFEWYCKYYYGEKSRADPARIKQWLFTINAQWFYIQKGPYMGSGSINTDLTYLPNRRQMMLEFGTDPTVDPSTYGCFVKF